MIRDYFYIVTENGYYIKDRKDITFKLYQYENEQTGEDYILYRTDKSDKDYAKYAQMHIDALKKADEESEQEKITLEQVSKELQLVKQDNETTKGALDTLMQVVMMRTSVVANDEPTPTLFKVAEDINTNQKGADSTMAAYIAKRVIDLEAQKEGAGKAYYKLYLSSTLWGAYKEEVDLILADLGHADLIVDLTV